MGDLCCPHCGLSNSGDDFVGVRHTEMTDDFYTIIFPYSYGICRNCGEEVLLPAGPPIKMIDEKTGVIDYKARPNHLETFFPILDY